MSVASIPVHSLMLWLSFFWRSLACAWTSASLIADDGSCLMLRSLEYDGSSFSESASEPDSIDRMSSSRSSACRTIRAKIERIMDEHHCSKSCKLTALQSRLDATNEHTEWNKDDNTFIIPNKCGAVMTICDGQNGGHDTHTNDTSSQLTKKTNNQNVICVNGCE